MPQMGFGDFAIRVSMLLYVGLRVWVPDRGRVDIATVVADIGRTWALLGACDCRLANARSSGR